MNGRIYDPLLGRFLSADSVIDGVSTVQGWNRYSYLKNNPLNATDPTGYHSEFTVKDWEVVIIIDNVEIVNKDFKTTIPNVKETFSSLDTGSKAVVKGVSNLLDVGMMTSRGGKMPRMGGGMKPPSSRMVLVRQHQLLQRQDQQLLLLQQL